MINELNVENKNDLERVNKFIKENSNSDYMQDIKWNLVRNEKIKYYLFYTENDEIIWACNLLEKEKNEKKLIYAPRGPILIKNEKKYLDKFLYSIKEWMNKHNYQILVMNPYLSFNDLKLIDNNFNYTITAHNDYKNLFESCKLAIMNIVFNEDELLNKLPSKFRQNTRRSYRKNLKCTISKNVDLKNFYDLYLQTAERHDFNPHTIDYFENLVKVYKDDLIFLEVWCENIPLAMSIDIIFNKKLIYLYGVSSTNNRNLLGMYYMQWEAIKFCIKNSISKYDFGGVFCNEGETENKDFGLYNFKKGYCYDGFIDIVPDITFDFGDDKND